MMHPIIEVPQHRCGVCFQVLWYHGPRPAPGQKTTTAECANCGVQLEVELNWEHAAVINRQVFPCWIG